MPSFGVNLVGPGLDSAGEMAAQRGQTRSPKTQTKPQKAQLHVCPDCSSELVQPVAWEQVQASNDWRLWRRCPECEWRGEDVHRETAVDEYDEQLDFGTRELAEELRALQQSNMEESVDRFVAALRADLILPEDF
jgi:hypothetical protein